MAIQGALRLMLAALLLCSQAVVADAPRIAIVIDDLGFRADQDARVLDLDRRVSVAIIPDAPAANRLARAAGAQRRDVLVHLPLAGLFSDDCDTSLRCIGLDWSTEQIESHLLDVLSRVDGARGINNHQGSRFTRDSEAVARLMTGLRGAAEGLGRDLLVLDSRTVADSMLERKALQAGFPATRRHVFLDHYPEAEHIRAAWEALIERARRDGQAIAIAHPRAVTLDFLVGALPALETLGIELVPVSELARRTAAPRRDSGIGAGGADQLTP